MKWIVGVKHSLSLSTSETSTSMAFSIGCIDMMQLYNLHNMIDLCWASFHPFCWHHTVPSWPWCNASWVPDVSTLCKFVMRREFSTVFRWRSLITSMLSQAKNYVGYQIPVYLMVFWGVKYTRCMFPMAVVSLHTMMWRQSIQQRTVCRSLFQLMNLSTYRFFQIGPAPVLVPTLQDTSRISHTSSFVGRGKYQATANISVTTTTFSTTT